MDRGRSLVGSAGETSHLKLLRGEMREDCKRLSSEIKDLAAELTSLRDGIAGTLTKVVGRRYREGLERIETSHQVYVDSVSTNLHNWVREFGNLASDMEREYNLTTNSEQVRIEWHFLYLYPV